jgi:hypothetical protein
VDKAEFIGKIRLLGVKLPTSILASAAFLKISFPFQPLFQKCWFGGKRIFKQSLQALPQTKNCVRMPGNRNRIFNFPINSA